MPPIMGRCVASRARISTLALLLALAFGVSVANSVFSTFKSAQSNPVLPVVVDGKRVNLLITTDMDGISLCEDRSVTLSASSNKIDYDYARKLLRYQLSGLTQLTAVVDLAVPSLGVTEPQRVPVGVFFLAQQSLSPTALAYFLHHSDADGIIGLGFAFRLADSPSWPLLLPSLQYHFSMKNDSSNPKTTVDAGDTDSEEEAVEKDDGDDTGDGDDDDDDQRKEDPAEPPASVAHAVSTAAATLSKSDFVAGQDESEQNEWDWSEPCASVDQADDIGRLNNQGILFPVHHVRFQCSRPSDESPAAPATGGGFALHEVDMFGDFTSSWDASVDFNSPCLVLPQQFYNSLAGWTGLTYSEDRKVSEIAADALLPPLSFALTYGGPVHVIDLNSLVLNTSNATKAVCIQRSSSIVHNGASVFAPIDTESTAQRYRLHGTMILPVYNMQQTPIVFGTMVLRALGEMLVDGEAKQVALPHPDNVRKATSTNALPVCQSAPVCIGQQEFSPRLNACLDPGCSSYYFQTLDPEAKVCVIEADWLTFLYTTVAVFVAAELVLSSSISRTVRNAISTAGAS